MKLRPEQAEALQLLTAEEAASILKVSERTIKRLKVPRVKCGRQYRYRPEEVKGFINLHIEYPQTGGRNVSRVQKKS